MLFFATTSVFFAAIPGFVEASVSFVVSANLTDLLGNSASPPAAGSASSFSGVAACADSSGASAALRMDWQVSSSRWTSHVSLRAEEQVHGRRTSRAPPCRFLRYFLKRGIYSSGICNDN